MSPGRVTPTIDLSPPPPSPLAAALEQFERAAEHLHLEPALREILRVPQREWTVRFLVELDDGSTRVFTGYRVHHNVSRGPARGGMRYFQETGSVAGAPGTEPIDNRELFRLDCDVLVPAALEGQITATNARDVRAKIHAEAANGPTLPEADEVPRERGVVTIPDILCNAGGVTVSYFEWAQNRGALSWTPEEVNVRLRQMMLKAFDDVWRRAEEHDVEPRLAAHALAIDRVAEATRTRGIFP